MTAHIETYNSLKISDREKVLAAARWGDGPFTRMILKTHFPKIALDEIPALIVQLRGLGKPA
ncbi:MAG TPA: hypothetical protein VL625_02610 [Patescibacteria group bacterium]|nr:hypothetical protein [Patescibacteria group bacterium]